MGSCWREANQENVGGGVGGGRELGGVPVKWGRVWLLGEGGKTGLQVGRGRGTGPGPAGQQAPQAPGSTGIRRTIVTRIHDGSILLLSILDLPVYREICEVSEMMYNYIKQPSPFGYVPAVEVCAGSVMASRWWVEVLDLPAPPESPKEQS